MKFRRHQPPAFGLDWHVLRAWLVAPIDWSTRAFRRLEPILRALPGEGTRERKWLLRALAAAGMFAVGYLFAALVLFPAPIFQRTQEVPRVVGLTLSDAEEALAAALLAVSDTELVSHPEIEAGKVVWQDPPPNVAVPEGAGVSLWLSRGPRPIPVPDVAGYERELAARIVEAAGLRIARVDTTIAPQERGVVVNTRPPAGRSLVPGSGVTLFVSVGTPSISVPDLTGLTIDEARTVLEEVGLLLGSTRTRPTTAAEAGFIIEQDPVAGALSAPGGAVNVTVVRGGRS